MRVVIVCPYAWDRFGGVQSHIRALSETLRERDHEVQILAPQASGVDLVAEAGVTIVGRAVAIPANGSMAPLSFGPVAARGVRRALDAWEPDVVHLHEPLIPSLSLLALRDASGPFVGTFHASAEASVGYWAGAPMLAKSMARLDVRTAVSVAARELIARYFPGDYRLTPNGVDVRRFASAQPADLGEGLKVLFLGRIEPRKGLDVLIEAMAWLDDLDVHLVVAGGGPERRAARSQARKLGVRALFLGGVAESAKPGVYRAADLYCAPGLGGESFGIVLIEAMAAGVPVVCSDLAAFRSVASDAARFVPPGDPEKLAEALRLLLTHRALARRLVVGGRSVAAHFDWNRLAAGVEDAYEAARHRRVASGNA